MKTSLLTLFASFGLLIKSFGGIIYVNQQATGANDGTSWANAFTNLTQAIYEASTNTITADSLFIAEGLYIPDIDSSSNIRMFNCPAQISLFGGFPASGNPIFEDRDWVAHPTVLEGDVLGDDNGTFSTRSDNARRLINFDTYGRLSGFVVRNGGDDAGGVGAGVSLIGTATRGALIENCLFENNWVTNGGVLSGEGGAIRGASINPSDQVEIRNVIFRNNKAKFGGALIYSGTAMLNNCIFIENEAELGSGIVLGGSSVGSGSGTVVNAVFYNNLTVGGVNQGDRSGVIARLNSGRGDLTVWNATFKDNLADSVSIVYGGLPLSFFTTTSFNNCLFDEGNSLPAFAIYENDNVDLNNCVGRFSEGWPMNGTENINNGTLSLSNWLEGQVIPYMIENTSEALFVLDCEANAFNGGSNSLLPTSLLNGEDLLGNPRVQGGTVDVGAYETAAFDQPEIEQQGNTLMVTNGTYDNYQWFRNDSIITGATGNTYLLMENGNYTLVANNNNACGMDTSDVVVVTDQDSIGTNIHELTQKMVSVWPNPANDFIQISSDLSIKEVLLYTLSGQEIPVQINSSNRIIMNQLQSGIYFIQVDSEKGRSIHRVIKQ